MKQLPFPSRDCLFCCNDDETIIYKYSKTVSQSSIYRKGFHMEYQFMKKLEENSPTASFFPRYFGYGTDALNRPFIAMEYIHGTSLEELLRQNGKSCFPNPQFIFSLEQLSHICQQVHSALSILAKNNILYFDLNPRNILAVNLSCDIRLVDFTFCCYLPVGTHSLPIREIDTRRQDNLPLSLTLENIMQLFFTRLFYCGNSHYDRYFHPCASGKNPTRSFFQDHFGILLDMVINPDQEYLSRLTQEAEKMEKHHNCNYLFYLNCWHSRLQKYLRKESSKSAILMHSQLPYGS